MVQRRTIGLSIARTVTGIIISMMAHFAVAAPVCRGVFNSASFNKVDFDKTITEIARLKLSADEAMSQGDLSIQNRLLVSTSKEKINELTEQLADRITAEEIRSAVSEKIRALQSKNENYKTAETETREKTAHLTIDKRGQPFVELKEFKLETTRSKVVKYLETTREVLIRSEEGLTLIKPETGHVRAIETGEEVQSALLDNKTWISIKKDGTVTRIDLETLKEKKQYRLGHRYWTLTKSRYDEYHISTQGTYILAKNWKDYFVFDSKNGKKIFKLTDENSHFTKFIDDNLVFFYGNQDSFILDIRTQKKYPIEMPYIYYQTIKKTSNGLFQFYDGENVYFIQQQDLFNYNDSKRVVAFNISTLLDHWMGRPDSKSWEFGLYPELNLIFASVGNSSTRIHEFYDIDKSGESLFITSRNTQSLWITEPYFDKDRMYFIEQIDSSTSALKVWGQQ